MFSETIIASYKFNTIIKSKIEFEITFSGEFYFPEFLTLFPYQDNSCSFNEVTNPKVRTNVAYTIHTKMCPTTLKQKSRYQGGQARDSSQNSSLNTFHCSLLYFLVRCLNLVTISYKHNGNRPPSPLVNPSCKLSICFSSFSTGSP